MDLSDLPVVDGHCHPLLADPWAVSPDAFQELLSEARPDTMPAHVSQTGLARRAVRDLARRLGAEPTVPAVLERRQALGPEGTRQVLAKARLTALLVDTSYPPAAMSLREMQHLLPCAVHKVFRIETCAQDLLPKDLGYEAFLDAFRRELHAAARRSVAFKSIIAYRSGLALQAWNPNDAARAYGEALGRFRTTGSARLTDKPLLDTLFETALEVARETGRPIQIHAGLGDPDIDLLRANPLLLRPVLEDPRWAQVRLVILHMAYPYFREAAFMTAVWPQAFLDLSLALPVLGPGAVGPLVEVLSLAPASKLLYGSDLRGLPELFALAADWARAALGEALDWLVARQGLSAEEARAVARLVLAENAMKLYGLPASATGGPKTRPSPA